MASDIQLNVKF